MSSKRVPTPPPTAFAPGDQVVRYMNGRLLYCTVIIVLDETQLLIRADEWPMGYTAPVHMSDVALVARPSQDGLFT